MASRARDGSVSQRPESKTSTSGGVGGASSEPTRKRQRVSRACDQCRASREKCNGEDPCTTCNNHGRGCTWNTPKKTRGLKTGYIRTLESALGFVFANSPTTQTSLHQALSNKQEKFTDSTEKLLQIWKTSTVRKKIEQMVSKEDQGQESSDDNDDQTPLPMTTASLLNRSELLSRTASLKVSPSLPANTMRLLDIYFSFTHNWFPILDKALVQKAIWSYNNQQRPDDSQYPEIWALFALASCQEESLRCTSTPTEIYSFARSLVPTEGKLGLSHIKALLLLTLVNLGRQDLESAWLLIGFACNLRFYLGHDWRSRYVLMGCALLDTLVSIQLDRPRHISENIDVPHEVDVQDEWEDWTPVDGFGTQSSGRFPARSISTFRSLFCLQLQGDYDCNNLDMGPPSASILLVSSTINQESRYMLSAIDDFILTFDTYALPPIFSSYMARKEIDGLTPHQQRRWKHIQTTIRLLYTPGEQIPEPTPEEAPESVQYMPMSVGPVEDDLGLGQNFGLDAGLDYDAIMNEIGLVDSRDMNAQFMINLGFRPDSSIDDMFSYDYGHTGLS